MKKRKCSKLEKQHVQRPRDGKEHKYRGAPRLGGAGRRKARVSKPRVVQMFEFHIKDNRKPLKEFAQKSDRILFCF